MSEGERPATPVNPSEPHWARGGEAGLPRAVAPFSQGVRIGPLAFTAGQASIDADANVVGEGDIRVQTAQTLRNVAAVLDRCGASLRDVVKMTIWLRDFGDYEGMNEVYAEWFPAPEPVRACVRAELVFPTLLVEMEAVAVVREIPRESGSLPDESGS